MKMSFVISPHRLLDDVTHQGTAAYIEGSDAHAVPFGFRRIQQRAARVGDELDPNPLGCSMRYQGIWIIYILIFYMSTNSPREALASLGTWAVRNSTSRRGKRSR